MLKKRTVSLSIVILLVISLFSMSSFTNYAQAAGTVTTKTIAAEKKAKDLAILKKEADKYGINIKDLSPDKAREKIIKERQIILDTQAKKVGVNIKGLSVNDAIAKIATMVVLQKEADKMGIDIAGLSIEDAKSRIISARKVQEDEKIQADAVKLGIDISGLSNADAWNLIKKAEKAVQDATKLPDLQDKASKLGIDITGLSYEDAKAKILSTLENFQKSDATSLDSFEDSTTSLSQEIINLVVAIKLNDKTTALKITQSKVFDEVEGLGGFSTKTYDEVKKTMILILKGNMNIDINAMSVDQVKAKLKSAFEQDLKEEAKYYGVDLTGLTENDARVMIDAAKKVYFEKELAELKEYAAVYNVDIMGLSKDDAWKKIKEFIQAENIKELQDEAQKAGVDISGLSFDDAYKKIKIAVNKQWYIIMLDEARTMGVDVSGFKSDEKSLADDKMMMSLKEKINTARDANESGNRNEEAKKLGIDITGLTQEQVDSKIMQAYADKYGVNIAGLSKDDAWKIIKEAMKNQELQNNDEQNMESLEADAQRLGVDIKGLSYQDAWKKIQEANDAANWNGLLNEAANFGVDITGLSQEDAKAKIRQAKADFSGVDINGLSPADADAKIDAAKNNQMSPEAIFLQMVAGKLGLNTQAIPQVMREQIGAALGINLNGLSLEVERQKILECLAIKGITLE